MNKTLEEHLDNQNYPKRILALDGGGIRGALTLGYLKRIETLLREKEENENLLLCDYFDLIGGTSTGSIIATMLAIGKSVDEVVELYMDLGGKIFGKKHKFLTKFFKVKFKFIELEKCLKDTLGDTTLGSSEIKTGLCIVLKCANTNSTWRLINHPSGKFYNDNKDIPLWQAVRASCAAPTYFAPQIIDVGKGKHFAFIDGGVSMANNPALDLLSVATMNGFPFKWKMGEDNLSIVSVGTGYSAFEKYNEDIKDAWLVNWAKDIPKMLMQDADNHNQTILQWLSNSPSARSIDSEIGDLKEDLIADKPLLKYLRYNCPFTLENLNEFNIKTFESKDIDDIAEMSNAHNRELLYEIGTKASTDVQASHFIEI